MFLRCCSLPPFDTVTGAAPICFSCYPSGGRRTRARDGRRAAVLYGDGSRCLYPHAGWCTSLQSTSLTHARCLHRMETDGDAGEGIGGDNTAGSAAAALAPVTTGTTAETGEAPSPGRQAELVAVAINDLQQLAKALIRKEGREQFQSAYSLLESMWEWHPEQMELCGDAHMYARTSRAKLRYPIMPDPPRALCPVRRGVITGRRPYARYHCCALS